MLKSRTTKKYCLSATHIVTDLQCCQCCRCNCRCHCRCRCRCHCPAVRRSFVCLADLSSAAAATAVPVPGDLFSLRDVGFMRRALQLAAVPQDEVPVGAVVVVDGQVRPAIEPVLFDSWSAWSSALPWDRSSVRVTTSAWHVEIHSPMLRSSRCRCGMIVTCTLETVLSCTSPPTWFIHPTLTCHAALPPTSSTPLQSRQCPVSTARPCTLL